MNNTNKFRVLIIGNPEIHHVGWQLYLAAQDLGFQVLLADTRPAYLGNYLATKWKWWLQGRTPVHLHEFSNNLIDTCTQFDPQLLISVGTAPITFEVLQTLRSHKIQTAIYLTDDPWNPVHKSSWFLKSLLLYNHAFTTRRANLIDLQNLGMKTPLHLPFGYTPNLHYPELSISEFDKKRFDCDILFAGGADKDRVPVIELLINQGFKIHLYGGYWDSFPALKPYARGMLSLGELRKAVQVSRVVLNLVRRANRDGSVMRSFEVPAMGACMLTEYTTEHNEILQNTVPYFKDSTDLISQARQLLLSPELRADYARRAHIHMLQGAHTYCDRLCSIIQTTNPEIFKPQFNKKAAPVKQQIPQ